MYENYDFNSIASNTRGSLLYLICIVNAIKLRHFIEKMESKKSTNINSYHSKHLYLLLAIYAQAHTIIIMCLQFLHPFLLSSNFMSHCVGTWKCRAHTGPIPVFCHRLLWPSLKPMDAFSE